MNDDLPLIRCRPTPSDSELAAERDAKHAQDVQEWLDHQEWIDNLNEYVPPWKVRG